MELRIGASCALILLLFLVITIRSEENESNESSEYGGGYNETNSTQRYNRSSEGDGSPGYGHSIYYDLDSSPSYGHYMHVIPSYGRYMHVMYGSANYSYHPYSQSYKRPSYNQSYQQSNYGGYNHSYQQISHGNYNKTNIRSPYQSIPGSYRKNAYNKHLYSSGKKYNAHSIYGSYLASGTYLYHSAKCNNHYGQTPQISDSDMDSAFSYAHKMLDPYEQHYGNKSGYSVNEPPLKLKEKEAIFMEYVSEYFAKYKCLSKYQTTTFLPSVKVGKRYITDNKYGDVNCYPSNGGKPGEPECPDKNDKYRSIDGSCNNFDHPYWGRSYVCHIRLLPPDYSDGVQAPRMSSYGHPLPSARTIANILSPDLELDSFYTHMKMAFGQYVNHDITRTPVHGGYAHKSDYSSPLNCCTDRKSKQCFPIDITPTSYDYQYRRYNNTCLNFVRSAPCPLCEIGPRQQMNIASSFIDCSAVYGSTTNESIALRTLNRGLLITSPDIYGKPILPATRHPYQNQCSPPTASMQCFVSGDQRVNQHPALQVMHTVFIRRHNQHATALFYVNPYWSDERIYQEARRITIAELQHITYNEYLPIIFGPTLMEYFSLNPKQYGYTDYEPTTDPTSWNDYATSACRFGHSQIQGFASVVSTYGRKHNSSEEGYWLKDKFFDPSYLWEGQIDGILIGLLKDHSKSVDPYVSDDIRNYLFRRKGQRFGSDLIARNIQRGRDHGIPGYVNYLKYCFGYEVYSWDDLNRFIPAEIVQLLKQVYKSWKDIDFYIAGLAERHFPDGDVGPTFACVLGIQYYHLKFGDRYYYEHGKEKGSFSLAQLENIRKSTTLSRLLCRASDYIDGVQRYAFFPESNYNPKIPCRNYPEINYSLWKDSY